MSKPELLFKIIIIGEAGVGKSCILHQYVQNEFNEDYNVTIGVEFASKIVNIDWNTEVKLQIWDTAGQESFRSIVKSFYRNASAAFLVYNISDRKSFEELSVWLEDGVDYFHSNVVLVLVGNQSDNETRRQVSYKEGEKFMKDNNFALFFETSAKTGDNIEIAFQEASKLIFLNYLNLQLPTSSSNKQLIYPTKKEKNPCC